MKTIKASEIEPGMKVQSKENKPLSVTKVTSGWAQGWLWIYTNDGNYHNHHKNDVLQLIG